MPFWTQRTKFSTEWDVCIFATASSRRGNLDKRVPRVYLLLVRRWQWPILKLVQAVVSPYFDECTNEERGSLARGTIEFQHSLVAGQLLTFSLSTIGFPAGVVSSILSGLPKRASRA